MTDKNEMPGEIYTVGGIPATMTREEYPCLPAWWTSVCYNDGKKMFARVYGATPQEANARARKVANALNSDLAAQKDEWRPIETAPKDGTLIFVVCEGEVHTAKWMHTAGVWKPDFSGKFDWQGWQIVKLHGFQANNFEPTHWKPLDPPPPQGE